MKEIGSENNSFVILWRGQQNSKKPPLTLICQREVEPLHTDPAVVYRGMAKFPTLESDHRVILIPSDARGTLVACFSYDVVPVKGICAIKSWDTGGYKNTGVQSIIMCRPGLIVKAYGYNRRTYGYEIVTHEGVKAYKGEIARVDDYIDPDMIEIRV